MGDSGRVDSVHRLPFIARLDLYTVVEVAWGKCAVGAPASVKREPALSCKGSARGTVRGRIGCPRCMVGCARARRDHRSGIPHGHHLHWPKLDIDLPLDIIMSCTFRVIPHAAKEVFHICRIRMMSIMALRIKCVGLTPALSGWIRSVTHVTLPLSSSKGPDLGLAIPARPYINVVGVFPWARGQVLGLCRCPPDPSHEQHRLQLVRQSVVPCFPATMCEAYHRG
jgi:hypothetical protein